MKSLTKTVLLFGLLCYFAPGHAQTTTTSPRLFDAYAGTLPCNIPELAKIFSSQEGTEVQVKFNNDFNFPGTVISSIRKFHQLKTVLIRSANFNNALFSISERRNDDNTITYVGRILHDNYADGYELKKSIEGNYSLVKIKHEDILQDR